MNPVRATFAFDDGIGGHRGTVNHVGHLGRGDVVPAQNPMSSFQETHRRVLGRGGDFSDADLPRIPIDEGRIGEGAANGLCPAYMPGSLFLSARSLAVSLASIRPAVGSMATR